MSHSRISQNFSAAPMPETKIRSGVHILTGGTQTYSFEKTKLRDPQKKARAERERERIKKEHYFLLLFIPL